MKFILSNFGDEASIQSLGIEDGGKLGPHAHQFFELCFVFEGTADVTIDGERRTLCRGDFVVIHPFRIHFIRAKAASTVRMIVISDKVINGFGAQIAEYVWGEEFVFHGSDSLFNYVSEHLPEESDRTEIEPDSLEMFNVRAIYYAVMEEYTRKIPATKTPVYSTALARIYEYVEKHFAEDIEIKDVARSLGYSPKYVSHVLSAIPDSNFRKILNSRRNTNAKWWLRNSDRKVIEIALQVGYKQERTFYRAFKEETGMTPFAYRKRYKRKQSVG